MHRITDIYVFFKSQIINIVETDVFSQECYQKKAISIKLKNSWHFKSDFAMTTFSVDSTEM